MNGKFWLKENGTPGKHFVEGYKKKLTNSFMDTFAEKRNEDVALFYFIFFSCHINDTIA